MNERNCPKSILPRLAKTCLSFVGLAVLSVLPLRADSVIVYARTNGGGLNVWPPYQETTGPNADGVWYATGSSGNSSVTNPSIDKNGTRFGSGGYPSFLNQPTLSGTGHVYAIYATVPITSTSPDLTVDVSTPDGTLSTNKSLGFRDSSTLNAHDLANKWNLVCYITNNPGVYQPTLTFTYSTTTVYGTNQPVCSLSRRFYSGPILYDDITDQCKKTPPVVVWGPLVTGQTTVQVANVVTGATSVTVYADGAQIGKLSSGVVAGVNTVPTAALVQNQEIKATQTTNNIEGCLPTSGPKVGGGANPEIRVSFILDQNPANAGPIGALGVTTGNMYHLPATDTYLSGYANPPIGNIVLQPGTCWQTVSAQNGVDQEVYFAAPTTMPVMPDPNPYASLVGIAFCVENLTNTGPFDLYIDNIKSGDQVIEDFEWATNGQAEVFLQKPSTATIPVSGQIPQPDISVVSTAYADSGTKSLRYSFQFSSVQGTIWIRALAGGSGHPNPQVDLTKPISMRVLLLPPGQSGTDLHASTLTSQNVWLTQTNYLGVTASGTGPFTYQWKVDGVEVTGATRSSYTFAADPNLGIYEKGYGIEVAISNATCGTVSSAILSVRNPVPSITNQPVHTIVNAGSTATLKVGADGHVAIGYPLYYQWHFNGVDLPGENSETLVIPGAQLVNAGSYDVLVSNNYGSTNSVVVHLDVVPVGVGVGNGIGLRADYWTTSYYTNAFTNAPTLTRVDPTVNFNWGTGSPDPSISADYFKARWTGQVQALGDDTYTFATVTDDGVRLWVNGQKLIDNWTMHGSTTDTGNIVLQGTNKYDIVMEYFENTGGATAQLWWSNATGAVTYQPMPTCQLYSLISSPTLGFGKDSTNIIFNWSGPFVLQNATNLAGPWSNLFNATSPYTNPIGSERQKFFRLQVQ
jgi:hypothetical protein